MNHLEKELPELWVHYVFKYVVTIIASLVVCWFIQMSNNHILSLNFISPADSFGFICSGFGEAVSEIASLGNLNLFLLTEFCFWCSIIEINI